MINMFESRTETLFNCHISSSPRSLKVACPVIFRLIFEEQFLPVTLIELILGSLSLSFSKATVEKPVKQPQSRVDFGQMLLITGT